MTCVSQGGDKFGVVCFYLPTFVTMFLHVLIFIISLKNCFGLSSHPLVLIVSYDAFRYDYLEKGEF